MTLKPASTCMTLKPVVTPAPTACAAAPPEASASVRALISRRMMSRVSDSAPISSLSPGRSSSHLRTAFQLWDSVRRQVLLQHVAAVQFLCKVAVKTPNHQQSIAMAPQAAHGRVAGTGSGNAGCLGTHLAAAAMPARSYCASRRSACSRNVSMTCRRGAHSIW